MREHLSQEELIRLAETPCEEDVLKRAFLFACLTGLRKSDIRQLTAADTTVHQRQDVRDHPYAEDEADCTQSHQ